MQGEVEVREEPIKVCVKEYPVSGEYIAQHLLESGRRILSTPCLILMMERTARLCLEHSTGPGKKSVGVSVEVRHRRSVSEGEEVRVEARLVRFDGRRAFFHLSAYSGGELVGEGVHERVIVEA